jgi:hypothetical protein
MNKNNKQYRVEILPSEIGTGMFEMKSDIAKQIIDCIKNLKRFAGFSFGQIDDGYDLRIMELGKSGKSLINMFLQYNTKSRRYRIIIEAPSNSHQIPSEQDLTMTNNINRSLIIKRRFEDVQRMLRFINNEIFWRELNSLYDYYKNFIIRYPIMGEIAGGGLEKKKLVKKQQKYIY